MTINQINIKNLLSVPLPISAVFNRYNQLSVILHPGQSLDVGSQVDFATVNRNSEIQHFKALGLISVTYTPGSTDLPPMPGVPDSSGRASSVVQHIHLTAAVGGTADDVVIYTANSPAMKILDSYIIVSAAGAGGSTVTLRTALAGGGSAVSSAFSTAATGVVRSTLASSPSLAAGSTLVARRSDNTAAGDIMLVLANA